MALTALAATSIEWYDFFIYGTAAAVIFPNTFFPKQLAPAMALAASFATIAVAFVARPLGAVLFGHIGDRRGRKTALAASIMLMGISTCLVGCLPSYDRVGAAAPACLIVLRMTQGIAIAGQWGGAILMITEEAPANRRAYYSSFAQIGVPLGVVLANLVFLAVTATLSHPMLLAWGWRIPFWLSASLILLGIYVHRRLPESPGFAGAERLATARAPALQALAHLPKKVLLGGGAMLGMQIPFYLFTTWILAYATDPHHLDLSRTTVLASVLLGSLAMIPVLPVAARISDEHGRRRVYCGGAILLGGWSFAFFPLVERGSFAAVAGALIVGQMLVGVMYGPQGALFAEVFPAEFRYSGASISYQVGAICGGGFAPLIASGLLAAYRSTLAIALYMAGACAITAVSAFLMGTPTESSP